MIVERWTFSVKRGCGDKMTELLKSESAPSWPFRLYTCQFGTRNRWETDAEFDDLTTLEKAWTGFWQSPGSGEFAETWSSLLEGNAIREIWAVIE